MSSKELPTTLCGTNLTIDWLVEKLQLNSTNENRPKLIEWKAGKIGLGQGFLSHIIRVNLTWENNDDVHKLPEVVVAKVSYSMLAKVNWLLQSSDPNHGHTGLVPRGNGCWTRDGEAYRADFSQAGMQLLRLFS